MSVVIVRLCILFTVFCGLLNVGPATAASRCVAQSGAAYELVFCQLKRLKSGASLPSLAEFRRNPPAMQYLLLKRRAQRQGLELVPPASLPASTAVSPEKGAKPASKRVLTSVQSPKTGESHGVLQAGPATLPADCRFERDRIRCAEHTFVRQGNKANSQLAEGVLAPRNTLDLGAPPSKHSEQDWLASAYERYLRAMLGIGLAGSSFTYSGFAHTYYEHQAQGTDFAARYASMFEYLKRDKKQLAVSVRRPNRPPKSEECEWLTADLLVCNSQAMNLVYVLAAD